MGSECGLVSCGDMVFKFGSHLLPLVRIEVTANPDSVGVYCLMAVCWESRLEMQGERCSGTNETVAGDLPIDPLCQSGRKIEAQA